MSAPASNLTDTSAREPEARWRGIGSWVLLVVFCIGLVASIVTLWARAQVLETDVWVETVTPLASDPAIQQAVADRITALLAERIQQDTTTRTGLAQFAAGAGMAMVLDFVNQTVLDFVASPEFEEYWVAANEIVHRRTLDALTSEAEGAIFLENGQLVLDLNPAIAQVEERLRAAGLEVVDRVEVDPARATFVLFESDRVRRAEEGIELLETLAIVLPILTVLSLVGCVLLAYRRWQVLIRVGVGMAVATVLTLVLLSVVRDRYLDALAPGRSVDALAATFDIVVRNLKEAIRVTAIVGLVLAGFAVLASSALIRQPRLVSFVARYRNPLVGGILAIACIVLVAVDQVTLGMAVGMGLLALAAVLAVTWWARLAVAAPA